MKPETKTKPTPDALIVGAVEAIQVLEQGRREVSSAYQLKIRKLKHFVASMLNKRSLADGELFDIGETLTPELDRLIKFPLAE